MAGQGQSGPNQRMHPLRCGGCRRRLLRAAVRILSSEDFARRARANLPHFLYEYIAAGSFDEITAAANRARLQAVKRRQNALHSVAPIDMPPTLIRQRLAMPIL